MCTAVIYTKVRTRILYSSSDPGATNRTCSVLGHLQKAQTTFFLKPLYVQKDCHYFLYRLATYVLLLESTQSDYFQTPCVCIETLDTDLQE